MMSIQENKPNMKFKQTAIIALLSVLLVLSFAIPIAGKMAKSEQAITCRDPHQKIVFVTGWREASAAYGWNISEDDGSVSWLGDAASQIVHKMVPGEVCRVVTRNAATTR